MNIRINKGLLAVVAASTLLAACTHVSSNINDEGRAEQIVFPQADKAVLKEGTFPTVEALRQIGPGVTKDQMYQLLGRPHFNEGLAGVHEWDYLFHFRDGDEVTTCQYKVIFDKDYHGQTFAWSPAECADRLQQQPEEVAEVDTPEAFSLSADSLFRFGGGSEADMLPDGRAEVADIAARLNEAQVVRVLVVGHTDRIGSSEANQRLSQQRADTVRQILINNGLAADRVLAVGKGEAEPVSEGCQGERATPALVQCLQPDRRVDVIAEGI
ncbi:OmpA family protein [Pseudoxanthomonas dokdonensis]|uniref:OmpA-like domain-containing protein n=1 Tax=Pseudoxanthomonas dokdonensis TaxID=344882 RepID=A0A0R0CH62_9GAMM|nr:OmpA family protein [Pseudoxanthomonas dokdonensis]KRG68768.1 hypothetical protein ABB29_09715 [Pseudoxanthomonas dokdonensis]